MCWVLTSEQAEAKLRVAKIRPLQYRVHVPEQHLEVSCEKYAQVTEGKAERALLASGTEQAEEGWDILRAVIPEWQAAASINKWKLCIVVWAVWSLRSLVASDECRENMSKVHARQTLEEMYKHREPVQGLDQKVSGEHIGFSEISNA